ncbi:NHLP bacteriocin export ABC transporter permease/ATPase subunit [Salinarimonas ramus]|uniref:NHLP family bacteriocin export ABC transporter permease/ATPase subunit n=1 Tax=Salinarimonas ramus TaxID=690164 RepID=A0A917QFV1_9HYPH|nr:NHLP bacteriocin export ABC transporter permease/ATPase subunit [Salinarimonas ramus]GGK48795.1 NHLP family bacteriocin export ABC transporter permease/ATPase subunit [Salinarimonas ramus]
MSGGVETLPARAGTSAEASHAARIASAIGRADAARRVSARDVIDLARADAVVLVIEGTLNLFVVEPNGRRHGLVQVAAGEIAFGFPVGEGEARVLAVPGAGTRIVAADLGTVAASANVVADDLARAVAAWVGRLEDALPDADAAAPGTAIESLRTRDRLGGSWAGGSWVGGSWTADLQRVHANVLARILAALDTDREGVWKRLDARRGGDTTSFDGSIGALAAVGAGTPAAPVATAGTPLLAAACLVAKAAGIVLDLPKGGMDAAARASDPLAMLAELGGFHTLPIRLDDGWWRADMGPLLAFSGPERTPVALLPAGPGRYEALDPATMRSERVSAANAGRFARDAQSLVRLLPSRSVGFRDVLGIGLQGLGGDVRRLVVAMLLAGCVAFAMPLMIEQIIGSAVPEAARGELLVLVCMMVAVAIAGAGFSIVQSLALLRIEGWASSRTQLAVFGRLLRLPTEFFRDFTAGDLSVRVRGVEEMRQLLSDNTLFIIMACVNGTFSLAIMLYYEVRLALTVAVVALVVGALNYVFGRRAVAVQRRQLDIRGEVEADVVQYLGGVTELRTNDAERRAFARWSAKFAESQARTYEAGRLANAGQTTNAVFTFGSVLAIVLAIGLITDQLFAIFHVDVSWAGLSATGLEGTIDPAQFMAFYAAFGQFALAVNQVVQSGLALTALVPTWDRLRPLLEAREEHQEGEEDPGILRGDIDVREVKFRYVPDQPLVLKGVSLSAKAGQFVAVVGPSGAGKSSLMRLLLGFDDPEAGAVFLDGMDIRQLNKRAVRRNFGVVLQTVRVMTGTIFENITSGTDMSEEDAWWAAEQVGFAEDIRRMPDGLHTMLSDGGSTLSGGQCQRLMLARAIIRRPRIMLLDEATSALDNEVQSIVTQALDKLNCTRVVIAHRLSTIANADTIYVVDAGRVVEHGTYAELMAQGGVFADLARRQLAE